MSGCISFNPFNAINQLFQPRCQARVQCRPVQCVDSYKPAEKKAKIEFFYPHQEIRRAKQEEIELLGIKVSDEIVAGEDPNYQFFVTDNGKILYKTKDKTYMIDKPEEKLDAWPKWKRISGPCGDKKYMNDIERFLGYESQVVQAKNISKTDLELANGNKSMTDENFDAYLENREIYNIDGNLVLIDKKTGKVSIKHRFKGALDADGNASGSEWKANWESFESREFLPPHYLAAIDKLNTPVIAELSPSSLDMLEAGQLPVQEQVAEAEKIDTEPITVEFAQEEEQKPEIVKHDMSSKVIYINNGYEEYPMFLGNIDGEFTSFKGESEQITFTGKLKPEQLNAFRTLIGADAFMPVISVDDSGEVIYEFKFDANLIEDQSPQERKLDQFV